MRDDPVPVQFDFADVALAMVENAEPTDGLPALTAALRRLDWSDARDREDADS